MTALNQNTDFQKISRSEFEAMDCKLIKQEKSGHGPMAQNSTDYYMTSDGRAVVHSHAMGGESFTITIKKLMTIIEAMKKARDALEKGDLLCENLAWSILNEAISAEEAQIDEAVVWADSLDCVSVRVRRSDERAASGDGVKELFKIPLFTRPAPPLAGEHAALCYRLKEMAKAMTSYGYAGCAGLCIEAADMLAADAPTDCARSHPHENMSSMCELRTEIARLNFKAALQPPQADAQQKNVTCQIYGHVVGACVECNTHVEKAQTINPMTDGEITMTGHRMASKYTHRSDPTSHSYGFVNNTLIAFVREVEAHHGIK